MRRKLEKIRVQMGLTISIIIYSYYGQIKLSTLSICQNEISNSISDKISNLIVTLNLKGNLQNN